MIEPEKWIITGLQPRSRSYYLSAIFSSTHKHTGNHINGFPEFLLPLLIPGKGTVDLIYTAIYLLKLLFHTYIFWLNISEEAVTLLQKCTYISLPITLFQYIFSFLTTENPTTNLETSDSAWIGLKTEKLNFCSHLYLTQSCAEKYLPATQGSRPPYPCCDSL